MCLADAYDSYKVWCDIRSHQPKAINKFSQDIRQQFSHHEPAVKRTRGKDRSDLRDKTAFRNLRLRASSSAHIGQAFDNEKDTF